MDSPAGTSARRNDAARWLLASLLAAVLISLLVYGSDPVDTPDAVDSSPPTAPTSGAPDRGQRSVSRRLAMLPEIPLQEALKHDPFAAPREPQPLPGADLERGGNGAEDPRITRLREQGIQMIVVTERGAAALIDGRLVHAGDMLYGYRVAEIRPDGILFHITSEEPHD